jgi:hypothetical protein
MSFLLFRSIAMSQFPTKKDCLLLSSILFFALISSANAFPQVADYPPRVIARPPERVVQKGTEGFSFVKVLKKYSLPISMGVVGTSLLTGQGPGLIFSVVLGSLLTCLCCSCCCCGRGSRTRNGGESDHAWERKHVSAQRQFFYTAFAPWRRFGRTNGLRNDNDSGFC